MNKTIINYHNGITAVVGPNGSGKSNVIEAIRWVLGEKSSKNLRSNKMQDVIFSGSKNHSALNLAEVSINFDNEDYFLNTEYSEVTVKRKLYRNGDSSYYINENICRLKDIKNLFLDTGLGEGSFSIISQGNVNEIIDGNSENRRQVIETAAGVFKYKKQKETTLKKLDDIKQNLLRITDHTNELKTQINNLENQAIKAKKYLYLNKYNRFFYKNRLILGVSNQADNKIELENKLKTLNENELNNNNKLLQVKNKRTNLQNKLNELDKKREKLHNSLLEKTQIYQNESNNSQLVFQKENFNQQRINEIENDLILNKNKIKNYSTNIDDLKKSIQENKKIENQLNIKLNDINVQFYKNKNDQIKKLIENNQNEYFQLMQSISNLENKVNYETEINNQKNNFSAKDKENLKKQLSENIDLYNRFEKEIEDSKLNIDKYTDNSLDLKNKINKLNDELEQLKSKWYEEVSTIHKLKAEYNSIKNSFQNYNNFYNGSKNILKNKDKLQGIYGAVSEFIDTDDQYALAIDTALGNRTQQIIVKNQSAAENAIQYLSQNKLGRTTFLPNGDLTKKVINSNILLSIRNVKGFIDIASNLIKIDKKFDSIKQYLLGNIIISDNLRNARKISSLVNKRFQVVTLAGEVINAGGSITGGKILKNNNGNISQKNKLINLKNEINDKDIIIENTKNKISENSNKIDELSQQLDNISNILEEKRIDLQVKKKEFDDLNGLIKNQKQNLNKFDGSQSSNYLIYINKIKDEINSKKSLSNNLKKEIDNLKIDLDNNNNKIIDLDRNKFKLSEKLKSVKNNIENTKTQLDNFYSQKENENNFINEKKNKIIELKKLNSENHKLDQSQLDNLKKEIDNMQIEIDKINQESNFERSKMFNLDKNIETYQSISLKNVKLTEKLNSKLTINNENIATQLKELKDNFDINLNQAISDFDEEKNILDSDLIYNLEKITRKELNILGPVDTSTIDIFNEINERYEFMNHQKQDLENSKSNLNKIMKNIDNEVKNRFKKTFNEVNDKFSQTFKSIFEGGTAHLKMSDSNDVLSTGIEIIVQPPGKKQRDISLLSGGEKSLTALALLFGILQVKTVPFIILDEAESALDSANVDRFARYMSRLKEDTQFIVITHRKETMVYADNLYGITMQNSGISNVLSVNLETAKNNIGGID
ncbi:chromosome segregation protein SMC [Lactobacillus sp. S2-2]|nr:chromosome segregation protein SMC [Lactobacillus sp. S2-2]